MRFNPMMGFECVRVSAAAVVACAGMAFAQPVLVTTPTTVSATDTTIGGVPLTTAEITVRGTTLTMNGRHSIASLVLERSGTNVAAVLTHTAATEYDYSGGSGTDIVRGLDLVVNGDVTVQGVSGGLVASRIDLDARGYAARTGPGITNWTGGGTGGGGGHGGAGVNGTGVQGGSCYDSVTVPVEFGAGGTGNCCSTPGAGGGRIRLYASGIVTIDGSISANGGGSNGPVSGGGAGGTVSIYGVLVQGTGTVNARGGNAATNWGAGGGGRVVMTYGSRTLPDSVIDASGGTNGTLQAGAGTIMVGPLAGPFTTIVDNRASVAGEATEFSGSVGLGNNLIIRGGGAIGPAHNGGQLIVSVAGNITIEANSGFLADARGHLGREGPGTTAWTGGGTGGGAGHGGAGSNGSGIVGGDCYGLIMQPALMGSGSTGNCCSTPGTGGGALRISASGTITNDGFISANAQTPATSNIGGGAGGSLWVQCNTLAGSGVIRARGASGTDTTWGAGGGGRIAVEYTTSTFPQANFDASGGPVGRESGGAGTVYLNPSSGLDLLIVDNKSAVFGEATEMTGVVYLPASLLVNNGGYIAPKHEDASMQLVMTGAGEIGTLGKIGGDYRGHGPFEGPGTFHWTGGAGGGGAGHGGAGSNGTGAAGGACYGSFQVPVTMGSGGTGNCCTIAGRGGGRMYLSLSGALVNNGVMSVNGEGITSASSAGGGAGGSLWISCGAFSGSGIIESRGGNSPSAVYGAGGGGRVAVYYASSSFPVANFNMSGGDGSQRGGAGTLFLQPSASRATLIVDNEGVAAESTEFSGLLWGDMDVVVTSGGVLGPAHEDPTFVLDVSGNVLIESGGRIGADGRGYAGRTGPGCVNWTGGGGGGGAGYGGAGGAGTGSNAAGGSTYGSETKPDEMGSGGGGNCCGTPGAGGGLIALYVGESLTVNGALSANAQQPGPTTGGGSGGGLYVKAGAVAGVGVIQANGANGADTVNWGGGGGGRIAIYSCAVTMPLANITTNAGTGLHPGGVGTVYFGSGTIEITDEPDSGDYRAGDTVTLTVDAFTTQTPATLTYEWRLNGFTLNDGDLGGRVSGATTQTLEVVAIDCDGGGQYECIVSDVCGSFPSEAALVSVINRTDYNQDGGADTSDVIDLANDIASGVNSFPPNSPDVNNDGGADTSDVIDLANAIAAGLCL